MKDSKRYYWIKLKTNFFNQETIDFLLSQKNGCEYIVLYQMLCLNTANNNGEMSSKIGEMIVPYNIDKIVRDTKYFDFDTVTVALELFKKLGLIYEEEDKILKITNFDEMVGRETMSAKRVREYRERKKALQCNNDVTQEIEYRDKSIEIRDKNISSSCLKIIEIFENEFARLLSPMEIETVERWTKSFQKEMIVYALSIAVKNNKKTFCYIEGILKNWKTCNYKTLEEVKQNETKKEEQENEEIEIYDYDWLNEEK